MPSATVKDSETVLQLVPNSSYKTDTAWQSTYKAIWVSITLLNSSNGDVLALTQLKHGKAAADCNTWILTSDGTDKQMMLHVKKPTAMKIDWSSCTFASPTTVGIYLEFEDMDDIVFVP